MSTVFLKDADYLGSFEENINLNIGDIIHLTVIGHTESLYQNFKVISKYVAFEKDLSRENVSFEYKVEEV